MELSSNCALGRSMDLGLTTGEALQLCFLIILSISFYYSNLNAVAMYNHKFYGYIVCRFKSLVRSLSEGQVKVF